MKKGWNVKKLGDICLKITDGSHNPPKGIEHSDYMMLSSKNIVDGKITFIDPRYLNVTDFETENKRTDVSTNDVLLTIVGTIGRTAVVPKLKQKFTLQRSVAVLKPNTNIVKSKYLKFILDNIILELQKKARGVAQKGIYLAQLRNISIPVPSISEQQRIVEIINEAFAKIDEVKQNAECNLQNAKELFQSSLTFNLLAKKNWSIEKLGNICEVQRGSSPRPIQKYITTSEDGVNWIKIGDTKNVDKYIYGTKEKITKLGALKSRFVDNGDFILSNSMSLGKPYIMKTQGYIHDGWFVLRLNKNIDSNYFYYLLTSTGVQNQFHSLAAGAIVKNISSELVKKTILPIPPLLKQHQIVDKLDTLSAKCNELENNYRQIISNCDEMKKSILTKAFNGEL